MVRYQGDLARQLRPRTASKAASTPHCSSGVRWPARSPNRLKWTAPTCSTSTRVVLPPISISGRNDADRALLDVGATRTTERGRKASDCTTTPKRGPCCSWPTPLGSRKAKMSPRRTEALHEVGDRQHLIPVFLVSFQCGNLGGECLLVVEASRRVHQRRAYRFRAGHARGFE